MANGRMIGKTYTYTGSNGKTYTVSPTNYMQNYDIAEQQSAAAAKKKQQELQATLDQNNQQTNANYDSSARQAYIRYMQNRKALPSSLNALGVRGGASETALMNLYNNYGTSHANNEAARNSALEANKQNYNDVWNAYEADRRADLDNKLQTALTNQQNQYNNELTQFSSAVHQFPSTSAGYKKYQKWIDALNKSSDPLRDIKIGIIRQQMATQFPNGNPSSGGSGSGRSGGGYSGGGYSGGGGNNKIYIDNTPKGYVNGNKGYYHGASSKYQPEYAQVINRNAGIKSTIGYR